MKEGSGKSRFAGRVVACASAALAVAAVAAPGAGAEPAVDEYTLTLPQASGNQHLPPGASPGSVTAPPGAEGSGSTVAGNDLTEDVKAFARKPELGAPPGYVKSPAALGTAGRGVPEIVADTVDESEGGAPALLAALGAIAAAGVWAGFRRRRSNLRATG